MPDENWSIIAVENGSLTIGEPVIVSNLKRIALVELYLSVAHGMILNAMYRSWDRP